MQYSPFVPILRFPILTFIFPSAFPAKWGGTTQASTPPDALVVELPEAEVSGVEIALYLEAREVDWIGRDEELRLWGVGSWRFHGVEFG